MEHIFRVLDFNVYNEKTTCESSDEEQNVYKDRNQFIIQMFGVNEKGETCSIIADDYKPFFYVLVGDTWTTSDKNGFVLHLKDKMGKYYSDSISECKLLKRKKLYGFDNNKEHKFNFLSLEVVIKTILNILKNSTKSSSIVKFKTKKITIINLIKLLKKNIKSKSKIIVKKKKLNKSFITKIISINKKFIFKNNLNTIINYV